jgi:chromosome segregation ATPase
MTSAEARDILRKQVDFWNAARLLHAACDQAAEAEKSVGETSAKVQALERAASALESDMAAKAAAFEREFAARKSAAEADLRQAQAERERAIADRTERLTDLQAKYDALEATHAARQKACKTEEREAQARVDALYAQYDELRAKIASIVGAAAK